MKQKKNTNENWVNHGMFFFGFFFGFCLKLAIPQLRVTALLLFAPEGAKEGESSGRDHDGTAILL